MPNQSEEDRYESLVPDVGEFHAYAVVYGGMSNAEAREFTRWVSEEKLGGHSAVYNLDLYYGVDGDLLTQEESDGTI